MNLNKAFDTNFKDFTMPAECFKHAENIEKLQMKILVVNNTYQRQSRLNH